MSFNHGTMVIPHIMIHNAKMELIKIGLNTWGLFLIAGYAIAFSYTATVIFFFQPQF